MRSSRLLLSIVVSLFIFTVLQPAVGQTAAQEQTSLQQEVEELRHLVKELKGRVDELTEAQAAKVREQQAGTARPQEAVSRGQQVLERNQNSSQDDAHSKGKETVLVTAGRDGFSISAPDKSYRLKVGGYVQADGKTFYDDSAHLLTNGFSVRRARLNIDGTVGKYVDYRLAPEFGNGSVQLYDAYADLKYQPYAVLRGGKFKSPLGLELLQTDTDGTFIERALPSDLLPNRDTGFQVYGDVSGRLTYAVAVVNGAADGANIDNDVNDGKDVVARVFATPFAKDGPAVLRDLGIGIATSSGRQNGAVLPSLKSTAGQTAFFSYASSASAAGRRLRYTPQLYYYNGPFGLLAEYVESTQAITGSGKQANISNHAWQVAGSWVLTGERKSYKGVSPNKGLEGGKNGTGIGAWEVAARYTGLDVDPTAFALKFADSTKSAKAARAWAVGLNWYPIRNARLSFDFEQTHFQGGAAQGNRPTEKALLNRLQVTF